MITIPLYDLYLTWCVLSKVFQNYGEAGYEREEAVLIEARRLIEGEITSQHGEEAWRNIRNIDHDKLKDMYEREDHA